MNKQLIITYFEEFKHWLNGGNVQVYYKKDDEPKWLTDEECIEYEGHDNFSHIMQNSLEPEDVLIAIDDEFLKFRAAMLEGKIVQKQDYFDKQWIDMKTHNFHRASDTQYQGVYRIKPEESKFKVGDWVRDLRDNSVFQINSVNFNLKLSIKNTVYVHWQPKPGEWCWFYQSKREIPTLGNLKYFSDKDSFCAYSTPKASMSVKYFKHCEPFLGQLPTNLQETL